LSVCTEQTHQQKSTTVVPTSKVPTRSRANADVGKEGQSAEEPNGAAQSKESNSVQCNTIITNEEQRMHLLCNLSSLIYYNLFRYSCCLCSHLTELITTKDGNFTHGYGYPRVPYPHGQGMGTLFCPWVSTHTLPVKSWVGRV
jgi:hypothetical protein